MGIDNIRHPIKDTVKADNSTYSSNKIESLIHSATELPTPAAADIGKIVSVVSDGDEGAEYSLEDAPTEVPVPAVADKGKVISVNASGEYTLKKTYTQNVPAGAMSNGITLNRIDLGAEASSLNPNECVLALADPTVGAIYFRTSCMTKAPDVKVVFSAISYESSKLYYYEIRVEKTATSIPSGTTVTKIEIG